MTATLLATLPFRDACGQHNGGMGARARTASWAATGLVVPVRLGEALTAALASTSGKGLVFGWWWWLGWHFLAR